MDLTLLSLSVKVFRFESFFFFLSQTGNPDGSLSAVTVCPLHCYRRQHFLLKSVPCSVGGLLELLWCNMIVKS